MVIAISYRGVGEINILTYMSQKLNVEASRRTHYISSFPRQQSPYFTKEKEEKKTPHLILTIMITCQVGGVWRGCYLTPPSLIAQLYGPTISDTCSNKPCDYLHCLSKNEQTCFCRMEAVQRRDCLPDVAGLSPQNLLLLCLMC